MGWVSRLWREYEPWNSRTAVDWGLFWVEKLPVLTLSNKPFRLIASVDTFERDAMSAVAVADFFNRDCKIWKVKIAIKVFSSKLLQAAAKCCWCLFPMNFSYFLRACSQLTLTIEINLCSLLSACRHGNSPDVTESLDNRKVWWPIASSSRIFLMRYFPSGSKSDD